MNIQRWLALGFLFLFMGIVLALPLWLDSNSKQDPTPVTITPMSGLSTEVQNIQLTMTPESLTPPSSLVPTLDPVVVDLMQKTGVESLGVGDAPYVVLAGDFTTIDMWHRSEGTASIYKIGDTQLALRLDPFEVTSGPDLYILLSQNPRPRTSSEALYPEHIEIGKLEQYSGAQNYDIPDNADFSRYKSVVIYSLSLQLIFTTAELRPVRG